MIIRKHLLLFMVLFLLGSQAIAKDKEPNITIYKLDAEFDKIYQKYYPKSDQDEFRKLVK